MAPSPDSAREQASRQASDWLILLQDDPDDRDLRARFEAWLAASAVHAQAWAETRRTADAIATIPPRHAGTWQPFLEAARGRAAGGGGPAPKSGRRTALRLAAVAAAACLVLAAAPTLVLRLQADHMAAAGEIKTVQLADGSTVTLAPGSAIAAAIDADQRRIRLLAGEAFFAVARDAARPFRVSARQLTVSVTGTAFDVQFDELGAAVAVEHGAVSVEFEGSSGAVSERLSAGQSLRVGWAGTVARQSLPAALVGAWRQGQLVAQDRPMGEVVARLRQHFTGIIVLRDAALAARPVTGVYDLDDPEQALKAVAAAHGASVRRLTPWLLIVTPS